MENPWNVQSIYDLLYFNCPSCVYKNHSKQNFINHASDFHPESIEFLRKIKDSLIDIVCPWELESKNRVKAENQQPEENYEMDKSIFNTGTIHDIKNEKIEDININVNQYCIPGDEAIEPNIVIKSEQQENEDNYDKISNTETVMNIEDQKFDDIDNNIDHFDPSKSITHNSDGFGHFLLVSDPLSVKPQNNCKICGKTFSRAKDVQKHLKNIHGGGDLVKIYKCDTCGLNFSLKKDLQNHVVEFVHNGIKCETCGKCYRYFSDLNRHIKTVHEGQKTKKCEQCGKAFSRSEYLKLHIKTVHEGQKYHRCEICNKEFGHAYHLKKHIKTVHELHKDHICGLCGKEFGYSSHLKGHIRTVHEGQI